MYRKYRSLLCNADDNVVVNVAKLKQWLTKQQPSLHPYLAHYQARINFC